MEDDKRLNTEELLRLLFMESSLENLLHRSESSVLTPAFSDYICALCAERGETHERVIKRADIEKSYGHQMFGGRRNPSRDMVLRLAFGFELDYEGTQRLLKIARKSMLYPRVKRDLIVIYCLHHHYSVIECELLLEQYKLPLLGEGNRNE